MGQGQPEGPVRRDLRGQGQGTQIAEQLIQQGADRHHAGGRPVGLGAAAAAKNHAGTKIVGVDSDWYQSAPEYKDIVLTSVQKGIARAVYDTIKAGADGKFDKKPYVGTLKNGGVSLAPFHDFEGSLPAGLTGELDAIKKEIVEGKTVVTSKSAFDAKGGSGK